MSICFSDAFNLIRYGPHPPDYLNQAATRQHNKPPVMDRLTGNSRRGFDEIIDPVSVKRRIGRNLDAGQLRGSLRNFSRKRPEATSLNHQYAIRRVVMRRR